MPRPGDVLRTVGSSHKKLSPSHTPHRLHTAFDALTIGISERGKRQPLVAALRILDSIEESHPDRCREKLSKRRGHGSS
jgi:hypothetical protein